MVLFFAQFLRWKHAMAVNQQKYVEDVRFTFHPKEESRTR